MIHPLIFALLLAQVPSGKTPAPAAGTAPKPPANSKASQEKPTPDATVVVHDPTADEPYGNLLTKLLPRELGPTTMGGRITDIAVFEAHPSTFYVASASGGLFKTVNNGTTFDPVFEREKTVSLGAVAVSAKDPNIVWVGTGEGTSRNSVAWGDGVYKSIDGGKTWLNMGLSATMHIGKIVIDPKNPDIVYVAALGRLWGSNIERGLFKTQDGGKTWQKVLSTDENTGAIDVKMDPSNNNNLLVAMWQRLRKPWDFSSGGPTSGIYRTTDAGRSFHRVTVGLPNYSDFGRIGFSFFRKNPRIVIATIEYRPDPKKEKDKLPPDGGVVKNYGGGTFRSTDGGESWKKVNSLNPRPFYFSLPVQDPVDENRVYVLGDSMWVSDDAGKTFKRKNVKVHADYHAFWIDPADNTHLIVGCDGGLYVSYDRGEKWEHINNMPIGQFYAVAVDMRQPYWIYGGMQDNQCWGIPSQTREDGIAPWHSVQLDGGDGFYCQVDPFDWRIVYTESQNGGIDRTNLETGDSRSIQPVQSQGNIHIRFNWSTPFIISPHNHETLYLGANVLYKSVNRGNRWKAISPDLTTNDPTELHPGKSSITPEDTGAERHCTITTISESPRKEGIIYVGTDDGQVQVTQDGGTTWTNVTANIPGLPRNTWCSRVLASKWDDDRAYALFDGHRSNDFHPYAYVTSDFGKTWKPLAGSLPDYDCLYVIREGEQNPDLLYLGSEMSLRFSCDLGKSWSRFRTKWPTVAVHDLLVHPRDLDLVIATHGRSLWSIDVSGLEALSQEKLKQDVVLAHPHDLIRQASLPSGMLGDDRYFVATNSQPSTRIFYYLRQGGQSGLKLTVSSADGSMSQSLKLTSDAGLNAVNWDGRIDEREVPTGDYRVTLTVAGKDYMTSVHVESSTVQDGRTIVKDKDEDGDKEESEPKLRWR